jgi:DNA-binding CsgD family transcriptional regulator
MRDKSLSALALLVLDHVRLGISLNETAERLGIDREMVRRVIKEIEQSI